MLFCIKNPVRDDGHDPNLGAGNDSGRGLEMVLAIMEAALAWRASQLGRHLRTVDDPVGQSPLDIPMLHARV